VVWPASFSGDLTAGKTGKILARVGDITRFRSAAAFASYTGTAPIEVSSGDVLRHRRSRAGDGQLNCCLDTMALTQFDTTAPAGTITLRKRAAGNGHKEAMRCLKRRLSDVSPGGQPGATIQIQCGRLTPYHRLF
jgi:transposase